MARSAVPFPAPDPALMSTSTSGRSRRLAAFVVALLALPLAGILGGCGDSGTTDPGDDGPSEVPAQLVGTWDAVHMVLGATGSDSTLTVDIIQNEQFSASFTMIIRSDASYEATLTVFGQPDVESGSIDVTGSTITFRPQGGASADVTWTMSGERLILDGNTRFDFNRDGTPEDATLHLEMEPA